MMWLRNLTSALRNRQQDRARFFVALGTLLLLSCGAWSAVTFQGWSVLAVAVLLGGIEFLSSKDDGRTHEVRSVYDDEDEDGEENAITMYSGNSNYSDNNNNRQSYFQSKVMYPLHSSPMGRNLCCFGAAYMVWAWSATVTTAGAILLLCGSAERVKDSYRQRRHAALFDKRSLALSYGGQQVHLLSDWKQA
eukprot:PhM_4_TR5856/c0_g1_i1/m.75416